MLVLWKGGDGASVEYFECGKGGASDRKRSCGVDRVGQVKLSDPAVVQGWCKAH